MSNLIKNKQTNKKIAVILFNLGGPDSLESVKEFLFNLFYDYNIIKLYNPFRWIVAKIISTTREEKSKNIYAKMGNRSTILPATQKQASLIQELLNSNDSNDYKVFVSMKYWKPFAAQVIQEIDEFSPDEILLIPLYPQFSTTTTKSSFDEFINLLNKNLVKKVPVKAACCYYKNNNFIKAHLELIKQKTSNLDSKYRILFSAHSLPKKVINSGDPYQWQIEETCKEIVSNLNIPNLDYVICYQSKVGPLEWLMPSTEDEIKKAAQEDIALIIVPIAFVSEHSETLVELDIDYYEIFKSISSKPYLRVPALNENEYFIKSLFDTVNFMLKSDSNCVKNNVKIYTEQMCDLDKFSSCYCNTGK